MDTVSSWGERWLGRVVARRLEAQTLVGYAELWHRHVEPQLGGVPLAALDGPACQRFVDGLMDAGAGAPTVRKTAAVLRAALRDARAAGLVDRNGMEGVWLPGPGRPRPVRPPGPAQVEALRTALLACGRPRDATLVSVLAYAGLRPQEALALRWRDVGARTVLVERALALGEEKATKTGRVRAVPLFAVLREELSAMRPAGAGPHALLFPMRCGRPWTLAAYRNWRRRVFRPAAAAAGLPGLRPYDLRHAFCSLLLAAGVPPIEVAADAGHSMETLFRHYAHVIADLRGAGTVDAEAAILSARAASASADRQ